MRKRNRPDWGQRVYKFKAYPFSTDNTDPIPSELWDKARAMRDLWNALVALRDQAISDTKDMEKKNAKPRWKQFNQEIEECTNQSTLDWEASSEVLDRFKVASIRAFKVNAQNPAQKGATLRQQYRIKNVLIPHRFTGGGMPVEKFFAQTDQAWRIKLLPQTRHGRTMKGQFGVNKKVFNFTLSDKGRIQKHGFLAPTEAEPNRMLPLPSNGVVKKVTWCGNHDRYRPAGKEWEWHLNITVEEPPYEPISVNDRPIAGLDLGWRIMAEGTYIRIGMLTDSLGRTIELRLPLFAMRDRRTKNYKNWYYTLYDLWTLDEHIGDSVEDCKAGLRDLLDTLPPGFAQMRERGLAEFMKKYYDALPGAIIREMFKRNTKLRTIRRAVNQRLQNRKEIYYRNIASWLTKTYGTIVWEGDLSLKDMAENPNLPALKNAAKYRQFVALSMLREFIRQAAPKNGSTIQGEPAADSTRLCWECNELVEKNGGALFLECPNGHKWDQDENSSKILLLDGLPDSWRLPGVLRTHLASQRPDPLDIPYILRLVAVPVSRT